MTDFRRRVSFAVVLLAASHLLGCGPDGIPRSLRAIATEIAAPTIVLFRP